MPTELFFTSSHNFANTIPRTSAYGYYNLWGLYTRCGVFISARYFVDYRRGYEEEEIEVVFAEFDIDGDRNLDEAEQIQMMADLEGQKVATEKHSVSNIMCELLIYFDKQASAYKHTILVC